MGRLRRRLLKNHRSGIHCAKIGNHGVEVGRDKLEKSKKVIVGAGVDATTETKAVGFVVSVVMAMASAT
jgi:hypothetical protein